MGFRTKAWEEASAAEDHLDEEPLGAEPPSMASAKQALKRETVAAVAYETLTPNP